MQRWKAHGNWFTLNNSGDLLFVLRKFRYEIHAAWLLLDRLTTLVHLP